MEHGGTALMRLVREALATMGVGDVRQTLGKALAVISEASGCESVGVRWKAGEEYPYYVTRGFGIDFVIRESVLCVRDSADLLIRLPDGAPQLACMCGAVIQGRTDPSQPYFTKGGSFWTNGTTDLLRSSPPNANGTQTRNYCNRVGYESVALIPLCHEQNTCGLLQLNSRTPSRFTEQQIEGYEELAASIARAIGDHKRGY